MCVQEQAYEFTSKFDLLSVGTVFDHTGVDDSVDYVPACITEVDMQGIACTKLIEHVIFNGILKMQVIIKKKKKVHVTVRNR